MARPDSPNLILVGLMGSGKSTVGAQAARWLGLSFVDTDRMVEEAAGRPVSEIFAREGEAGFRRREAEAVASACSRGGQVIATGGGAVLEAANRERLWSSGLVVWLDAPPEVLARRLPAPHSRPLLASAAGAGQTAPPGAATSGQTAQPGAAAGALQAGATAVAARLEALLAERRALYAAAHRRVDTAGREPQEVAEEVAQLYKEWSGEAPSGARPEKSLDPPEAPAETDPAVRVVPVSLGNRSYQIVIGAGLLGSAGEYVRRALGIGPAGARPAQQLGARPPQPAVPRLPRVLVVTSVPVGRLWLDPLVRSLEEAGFGVHTLEVPDGEEAKTLAVLARAYDACAAAELDRASVVIALGGGAVGDLAGLVAATYLRGLAFVQVPTTLLAQVDASVGGKVAVNHPRGKNLIGAFHQPRLVLADTATLATLPDREFRAGLAEVVKHGVIGDPDYLRLVEIRLEAILARDPEALAGVVAGSCRIKANVVEVDEREAGPRANLNYGHTAGHALEAAAGFSGLLHGEAVALGMLVAARLGGARGWAPGLDERLERLLGRIGLPVRVPGLPLERVMAYMQADKKASGGRLTWVLARRVGMVEQTQDVDLTEVERILLELGAQP